MKFLFQFPCCSCFCYIKKKKSKPKEEGNQAWCALLLHPFHFRFGRGFPFASMSKGVWSSVQNCTVWTSCVWSECTFYHQRSCHSDKWCKVLNCLPYHKSQSLISFFCLYLWLLFCGCPSPSSVVQQARAQLQPGTYNTEMALRLIIHQTRVKVFTGWIQTGT